MHVCISTAMGPPLVSLFWCFSFFFVLLSEEGKRVYVLVFGNKLSCCILPLDFALCQFVFLLLLLLFSFSGLLFFCCNLGVKVIRIRT